MSAEKKNGKTKLERNPHLYFEFTAVVELHSLCSYFLYQLEL